MSVSAPNVPTNLSTFGAKGDGISDDTVAIVKALEAARGSTLIIPEPEDTYLVKGDLIIYSDTAVIGQGNCTFRLANNANRDVFRNEHRSKNSLTRDRNIYIENIHIDGNSDNQPTSPVTSPYLSQSLYAVCGIRLVNVDGFGIRGSSSNGNVGYGIEIKSSTSGLIHGSACDGNGDDGFSNSDSDASSGSRDIVIEYCSAFDNGRPFTNAGNSGFEVDDGPDNITYIGCRAENNHGRGFEIHVHSGAAHPINNITYKDCVSVANNASAEYIYRSSSGFCVDSISDESIKSLNIKYVGCYSAGHNNREFDIGPYDGLGYIDNLEITGCTIDYSNTGSTDGSISVKAAMRLYGVKNGLISNNRINGVLEAVGIDANGMNSGLIISDNTITGCHRAMIISSDVSVLSSNASATITGNRILNPTAGTLTGVPSIFIQKTFSAIVSDNIMDVDTTYNDSGIGFGFTDPVTNIVAENNIIRGFSSGVSTSPNNGINAQDTARTYIQGNIVSGFTTSVKAASTIGVATLVSGAATVSTSAITTTSIVILTVQSLGTVTSPSALYKGTVVSGTSFVINSSASNDTSRVGWTIIN